MFGARAVRDAILDQPETKNLRTIVVWTPMIDDDELPAAVRESAQFAGRNIMQYWDGKQLLGHGLARSIDSPEWSMWSIYLYYPAGAEWTDREIPRPDTMLKELYDVVVANKGKLQPLANPSALSGRFGDSNEVVGELASLPILLHEVATRFATNHEDSRAMSRRR